MTDDDAKSTTVIDAPLESSPTSELDGGPASGRSELSHPPGTSQPRPAGGYQLKPGDMVAEYRVTGILGKGGMGTVYAGIQPVIGKRVAIKILQRQYVADEEVVHRFVQEARAVNQARSRHIVDIFSFGTLPSGAHYFVMEQLEGQSLREQIKTASPLPFEPGAAILRSVAKGLLAAHDQGIVHRDLKPENIMLVQDEDGSPIAKILDFGIAKLQRGQAPDTATKTGTAIGTPYYMSPEQCRGVDVDHRTDIYALGVMMYELFTGELPFDAPTYVELVSQHLLTPPPRPSKSIPNMSQQLEAFILRCLAKDPAERPQTMRHFLAQLDQVAPTSRTTRPAPDETLAAAVLSTLPTPDLPSGIGGSGNASIESHAQNRRAISQEPVARSRGLWWVIGIVAVSLALAASAWFVLGRAGSPSPAATTARPRTTEESRPAHGPPTRSLIEQPRPRGGLFVTTGTATAEYSLDGSVVGRGPRINLPQVSPGQHEMTIRAPGYRPWHRSVRVEAGQRVEIEVQLKTKRRRRRARPPSRKKRPSPATPSLEDPDDTLDPFSR